MTRPEHLKARLLLTETAESARLVARDIGRRNLVVDVVALSPFAEYELSKADVPFRRPQEFVSDDAIEQVGMWSYQTVRRICDLLDEELHRASALIPEALLPGSACFFWLKVGYDAVLTRVLQLEATLTALKPARILYYEYEVPTGTSTVDFPDRSIYSALVPLAARAQGLTAESLGTLRWPASGGSKNRARQLAGAARAWAQELNGGRSPTGGGVSDKNEVLCLDSRLVPALAAQARFPVAILDLHRSRIRAVVGTPRQGRPVDRDLERAVRADLQEASESIVASPRIRREMMIAGLDSAPVFEGGLRYIIRELTPRLAGLYAGIDGHMSVHNTRVVVGGAFAEPEERVIAQAATARAVAVVAYDHGAMGYFDYPMEEHLEQSAADHRLVWGEAVKEAVERRYPNRRAIVHAVGSTLLDSVSRSLPKPREMLLRRAGIDPGRTVVMYVPTNLSANRNYISHRVCSDSEYHRRQARLLQIFESLPETEFVVKLHPSRDYPAWPLAAAIADRGSANCVCIHESLEQVLGMADVFINDSPTTTLLLMMLTSSPILAMSNGQLKFEPEALPALAEAVDLADNLDELEARLRTRLATGDLSIKSAARHDFLTRFGTYQDDGRSAERAAAFVFGLAAAT